MRNDILRIEKGGYSKTAVLTKIDALNALLMAADSADPNMIRPQLDKVNAIKLTREKGGLFGKQGFSVEDTDAYIAKLEEQLMEKLR